MRTVDPEQWHRKVKKAIRGRERLRFGSYQASQFEVRLRSSFADAMRELAKNSSVGGTELVRSAKKPARSIYCTLVTLTLTTAFLLIVVNITLFNRQPPLFVSQQLLQHPLLHVDFPAVALCSYTVITKTALDAYATRLANRDNNGTFTLPQIRDNLMAFGGLVTRTREPFDLHFMKFLSEVDQETNITNIMLKLSPDCEATLARCSWHGRVVPCRLLFAPRVTGNGFCCVMNSRYSLEDQTRVSKKAKAVGQEKGLMVVVKENTEDSAFMRSPSHDIEITLFDGLLYPLTEISGVHSYRARYNASVFFRLLFKAQDITRQMHYHSEEFRGCRSASMGTEAACVLECRRRATIALCSCVPFNMQPQEGEKVCSPEHLYCLNKHREKLTYYNPGSAADSTLDNEKSNGVKCLHCRPDCRHVTFSAAPAHVPYDYAPLKKLFRNKLLDGVTFTNSTVIRIFYASEDDQIVHILETNLRLYEDIALLGSQWILLCGASLICLNELVYFSTIRWAYHYFRRRRIEGTTLNFTFSY